MTEQTVRKMIQQEVYEAYQAGIDHESVPSKYPPMERDDIAEATDRIISIVRGALIPSLSKYAYEQSTPVALSELDGSPTWEEACARQHSITAYISSDIYKLINAAFGKEVRDV